MKKLFYSIIAVLSICSLFAFNNSENSSKIDESFCIEVECKKDPKCPNQCEWYRFKEVIYAATAAGARQIAVDKNPGCRVGSPNPGNCK
jgi:hypothetical protein